MPLHQETKILPYTEKQVFDLVMDIGSYPSFLPWCEGARITKPLKDNIIEADLIIGYKMFREKFSSKVIVEPTQKITVEYQSGPMDHLSNYWQFTEMPGEHCEIDFYVDFEFRSKIFQHLASLFFHEIIRRMVGAFEQEANKRYTSK